MSAGDNVYLGFLEIRTYFEFSQNFKVLGYRCATGDYCTYADTSSTTCGDGVYDSATEECDLGFSDNLDGCTNQCKYASPNTCTTETNGDITCVLKSCGDGIRQENELCDDGIDDGFGCVIGCVMSN